MQRLDVWLTSLTATLGFGSAGAGILAQAANAVPAEHVSQYGTWGALIGLAGIVVTKVFADRKDAREKAAERIEMQRQIAAQDVELVRIRADLAAERQEHQRLARQNDQMLEQNRQILEKLAQQVQTLAEVKESTRA